MTIFVNDIKIKIFTGANIADAVRAYYSEMKLKIPHKLPEVKDRYGNSVAIDGQISNGNHIYINIKHIRHGPAKI